MLILLAGYSLSAKRQSTGWFAFTFGFQFKKYLQTDLYKMRPGFNKNRLADTKSIQSVDGPIFQYINMRLPIACCTTNFFKSAVLK
jgi:hypothetical protein